MKKIETSKIGKMFILAVALMIGFLMPYLSRIPLAFFYDAARIWRYMLSTDDFIRWNGFHLLSLFPLLLFGFLYISGNVKWAFYAACIGHFAVTFLIYFRFGEPRFGIDDFLGCIIFPPVIAVASFFCGAIGLITESFISRRQISAESARSP